MNQPKIAGKSPAVVDLEPGVYWWCRCGLSTGQPFCDGSHAGTEFSPIKVTIEEKKKVALCTCKHTKSSPVCDGTHAKL